MGPYLTEWNTGDTGTSLTELNPGDYSVTITDANNCTETGNYFVSNPQNPLNVSLYKKDVNCAGGTDGAITINATGGTPGYIYSWEFNGNYFSGSSAANLSPGIYNITVSDAQSCDMDTAIFVGEPEAMEYSYLAMNPSCIGNNDGRNNFV